MARFFTRIKIINKGKYKFSFVMEVEIFSSEICDACDNLEVLLDEKEVGYDTYDVIENEEARKKLMKILSRTRGEPLDIPVWCTEDACYKGYREREVREVLDL